MLTLSLETAVALLKLVFVGAAAAVSIRIPDSPPLHAVGWRWFTLGFLLSALSSSFQAVWAVLAVRAGPEANLYEGYIHWMPAMHYSRYTVTFAMALALSALPFCGARVRSISVWTVLSALIAAAIVGVVAGVLEGPYVGGRHTSRLAVLQVVETVLLLCALLVGVLRASMDAWLWITLLVYAVRQALNSLLWAAAARGHLPGEWRPPFWLTPSIGVAMWLLMIGLVVHRLRLAHRGVPVAAIFGDPESGRSRGFRSILR